MSAAKLRGFPARITVSCDFPDPEPLLVEDLLAAGWIFDSFSIVVLFFFVFFYQREKFWPLRGARPRELITESLVFPGRRRHKLGFLPFPGTQ